jgi:ABC-2 type transport system ATP-binding protein
MRELLRELGSMGKTIILSSHILAELAELCDTIGIIERSHLVASGPLDEIRRLTRQGHNLRIKSLSPLEDLETALRAQPGVGNIYPANGFLEVEFLGDDQAAALLLENLIHQGIRVVSFSEMASDLEDIFLRLTKGEVA